MKKIISLCLAAFVSISIFAAPSRLPDSSVKIKKIFHQDFPEATYFEVYRTGDDYMVYFKEADSESCGRVYYDANGNITQSFKYYSGEQLSPFIRAKIAKKYSGESIGTVTEVINNEEHYFQIILNDSKQMFIINSDTKGNLQLMKKYKRA